MLAVVDGLAGIPISASPMEGSGVSPSLLGAVSYRCKTLGISGAVSKEVVRILMMGPPSSPSCN
jgi:hypothetical protein